MSQQLHFLLGLQNPCTSNTSLKWRKKSTSMCAFRSIQIREQVVCISKYASQGQLENVNLSSFLPSCIAIPHGGIEVDPTFEEISPKIALYPTFRWKQIKFVFTVHQSPCIMSSSFFFQNTMYQKSPCELVLMMVSTISQ